MPEGPYRITEIYQMPHLQAVSKCQKATACPKL